jgi:hypothetical protein
LIIDTANITEYEHKRLRIAYRVNKAYKKVACDIMEHSNGRCLKNIWLS